MSLPILRAYPCLDVAAILPQNRKDSIDNQINQAKVNLKKWSVTEQKTTNYWPIAVAIGAILCLAGVFLTLSAHRILPRGVSDY